jgi:adenylate cyclase
MADAARRAHAEHYADLAAHCWRDLLGPRRETGLAMLAAELANLRAAWQFWVGERDLDQLDRLVDSLWVLYDARGWYHATIELTTELMGVLAASDPTPERAGQLITLQTSLGRALLALKGYTGEVEAAFERALELADAAGDADLPPMFPVLRALSSFHIYRADFVKGLAIGERILRLAAEQEDASMLVTGHFVVGSNRFFMGEFASGLAELELAIEAADLEGPATRRFRLGNDPRVAALMTSGLALWLLGFPDRALERGERALALALRSEHPFTIAYAHFHVGLVHLWRREPALAETRAASVLAVAEASDIPMWRAVGTFLLGAAETSLGRFEDGLARIERGLALYQGIKSPPVFWPVLRFVHGVALAQAGRWAEAETLVDEAIDIVEPSSRMMLLPEFFMLRASLLLAGHGEAAKAEAWLEQAADAADTLGARMSLLRAATRLARLWRDRGEGERAATLLRPIYEGFTDGLATADLEDARELLASLP